MHKVSTLRDVKAGEELTFDYEIPLWFNPAP
jgi:SET domain-containing protein